MKEEKDALNSLGINLGEKGEVHCLIEEVSVKNVSIRYWDLANSPYSYTLALDKRYKDIVSIYSPTVSNHRVYFGINYTCPTPKVEIQIGCKKNLTIEIVESAIRQLEGKTDILSDYCIYKKGEAESKVSKIRLLDHSDKYFISTSNKAYSIHTHEVRLTQIISNPLKLPKYRMGSIMYRSVQLNEDRDSLLSKLKFFKEVMVYIKDNYIK